MSWDGGTIYGHQEGDKILKSPVLDLSVISNDATGEVNRYFAKYQGLTVNVYPSGAWRVKGSFHKYFNRGEHNYNNFSYLEFLEIYNDLIKTLRINPKQAYISRIEVGVNIIPHIPTRDLLTAFTLHKSRPFNSVHAKGIDFLEVIYNEYGEKAYDKAKQYRQPGQKFRFEHYATKSRLRETGIRKFEDLKDPDIYNGMGEILIREINNCLIIDSPDYSKLTTRQALYIKDWMNPNYLGRLSGEYIRKGIKRVREFVDTYDLNSIHEITTELISEQILKDQAYTSFHHPFLTMVSKSVNPKDTYPVFNHLDNCSKNVIPGTIIKQCSVTGLDISMQEPNSEYLTPIGLRFYKENNPDKYMEVLSEYGPYDPSLDEDTNFNRIAHRIRNYVSDQWRSMRNLERRYLGNYSLFENEGLYGNRAIHALLLCNKNTIPCHSNQV